MFTQSLSNSRNSFRAVCLLLLLAFLAALGGCADFTAGPAPLERTVDPLIVNAHSRAGKVYCARGYLGIFSIGMMQLADRIDQKEGIVAVSTADLEAWRLQDWLVAEHKKGLLDEPLVLLGHSYGADDMIRVAERLSRDQIQVDLLVLIDPVTPPPVPANVKRVYCVFMSRPATDWAPWWRGVAAAVPQGSATQIENIDLRTAKVNFPTDDIPHNYIDKNEGVQNLCIEEIKKVCPPRKEWIGSRPYRLLRDVP